MIFGLQNTSGIGEVMVRGVSLANSIRDNIVSVDVDMGTDQVSELSFSIEDPNFEYLRRGIFDKNTPVNYRGLKLIVSVVETTEGGGLGGLSIKCRPLSVSKLKKLRGKFTMRSVTSATYVQAECAKAGVTVVAQPGQKKKNIARDIPQKGTRYDQSNYPSAWTTIQRLASEQKWLMFELGGVIYFGSPEWIMGKSPNVSVNWYLENGTEPYTIPSIRDSLDSTDIEVSMDLPIERAGKVFPGYGLVLNGFPKYAGTYLIKNVSYPLVGTGTISVSASTFKNPKPQKAGGQE